MDSIEQAVDKLELAILRLEQKPARDDVNGLNGYRYGVSKKPEVVESFGALFSPQNIASLIPQQFQDFLSFKNNHHWNGLNMFGSGKKICADMELLRRALTILVTEDEPIEKRLNTLRPDGKPPMIPLLGRAVLTAILQVVYPDKYGVWNGTSEAGLKKINRWPSFLSKDDFGERYAKVNEQLLELANGLGKDLWTLDIAWWGLDGAANADGSESEVPTPTTQDDEAKMGFPLERSLRDFLVENWMKTPLGKEFTLYEEDGELVGVEYSAGSGKIDLLARNVGKHKWLVVELKKHKGSDQVVGQILRYMGWVEENLAAKGDLVEGIIITPSADERVRLALKNTKNINLYLYEVSFSLSPAPL